MTTIILKFRSCDHMNAVNGIGWIAYWCPHWGKCENIVALYWMSVICVMVVLEPFNSQWNVFPTSFKKKKNPISERAFSACVMIHCTFCAVHSGAVDSKGHQGVLLGKRWFLSLPREQSNSSGCHFRASWNNLQFIAAVVIALNWSWAHFAHIFSEFSTRQQKLTNWMQLKGIVFALLTIHKLVLQLEMSHPPSQNGKTCLCICWGLVYCGEMELYRELLL